MDAYEIYCQHQIARGQPAPPRKWWDRACARSACPPMSEAERFQSEIDRERREGWDYAFIK